VFISPLPLIRSTFVGPLSFVGVPVVALVLLWATAREVALLSTIVALLAGQVPGRVTALLECGLGWGRLPDGRLVEVKLAMLFFRIVIAGPRCTCILLPLVRRLHSVVHPARPLCIRALSILRPRHDSLSLPLIHKLLRFSLNCRHHVLLWGQGVGVHTATPLLNLAELLLAFRGSRCLQDTRCEAGRPRSALVALVLAGAPVVLEPVDQALEGRVDVSVEAEALRVDTDELLHNVIFWHVDQHDVLGVVADHTKAVGDL